MIFTDTVDYSLSYFLTFYFADIDIEKLRNVIPSMIEYIQGNDCFNGQSEVVVSKLLTLYEYAQTGTQEDVEENGNIIIRLDYNGVTYEYDDNDPDDSFIVTYYNEEDIKKDCISILSNIKFTRFDSLFEVVPGLRSYFDDVHYNVMNLVFG